MEVQTKKLEIDFNKIMDEGTFYNLVSKVINKDILKACLSYASRDQCLYVARCSWISLDKKKRFLKKYFRKASSFELAQLACYSHPTIALLSAKKLLSRGEKHLFVIMNGATKKVAEMFANDLLPRATLEDCFILAKDGKSKKIKMQFAIKLYSKATREECAKLAITTDDPGMIIMYEKKITNPTQRESIELANSIVSKIALKHAELSLEKATMDECEELAEYAPIDKVAEMFAFKLLPHATRKHLHLKDNGKTKSIQDMFEALKKPRYYEQFIN